MNSTVQIMGAFQNSGYAMERQIAMMPQTKRIVVCIAYMPFQVNTAVSLARYHTMQG